MILNCVTVDDEPLALDLVNSFVQRTAFLQLADSFGRPSAAVERLKQGGIHLVFLDIRMAGMNGIEIARMLHGSVDDPLPRVIFSTAYNQFAVESYQVDALDYLLKPFEYEDFLRAAQKGLQFFQNLVVSKHALEEEALYVRAGYQQVRVLLSNIKYIQGLRDYAAIHLKDGSKPVMTLSTLKVLQAKLPGDRFIRVQRSFIVSLDSVTALATNHLWIDQQEISIGEQYKTAVRMTFESRL